MMGKTLAVMALVTLVIPGGACGGDGGAAMTEDATSSQDAVSPPDADATGPQDAYCALPEGTTGVNSAACPPPPIDDPPGPNRWPASSLAPCCETAPCSDAACAGGELCDRRAAPVAAEGATGVCRHGCRHPKAAWTCFSRPQCGSGFFSGFTQPELETTHDCAEGETCVLFDYRWIYREGGAFVSRGLCVPDAPAR